MSSRWVARLAPLPIVLGYCYYVAKDRFAFHHERKEQILRERKESELYQKELNENIKFISNLKKVTNSDEESDK